MRLFPNLPLRHRLTLLSCLTSTLALLLTGTGFIVYEQYAFKQDLTKAVAATAQMIGYNSASALSFNDPKSAEETLQGLAIYPHITAACVYDAQSQVFAIYPHSATADRFGLPVPGEVQRFGRDRLELFRPIMLAGETVGTIYLRSDLGEMHERLRRYALLIATVMIAAMAFAYLLALRLQKAISGPVSELASIAGQVGAQRNYSVRAVKTSNDELGQLIDGFNDMLTQIQGRDNALQSAYASLEQRVAERTAELKRENGERREAEEQLRAKTAILEAQIDASIDGILVVDGQGKKIFQNRRTVEVWRIPPEIADGNSDEKQVQFVLNQTKHPEQFAEKVRYLYAHPTETSRDEIELKDGTVLDRYSAPVIGKEGKNYGRIWAFRDITEHRRAVEALRESEERFSGAFAYAPIGVALVSPTGHWLKVNRAVCALVGYSEAELLARTFQDITHPDDLEKDLDYVRQMIAGEIKSYQMEKRYVHAQGHLVAVLLNVSLVRDGHGDPRYFISQIQDITERKRAQEALQQEQELLTAILENVADGILACNAEGAVTLSNRTLREFHGLPLEPVSADRWADYFSLYLADGVTPMTFEQTPLYRALHGELVRDVEVVIAPKHLPVRRVVVSGQAFCDLKGVKTGAVVIVHDITARRQAEARLADSHRQLLDISRQAGMAEIATGVLHNVGNVLNSVNVSATLVTDHIRQTKAVNVAKLAALFTQNQSNLGDFLQNDPRGQMVPGYLDTLAQSLTTEREATLTELEHLRKNIEHIKEIVAMQQSYARTSGFTETISVPDLIEDALRMNADSLARNDVEFVRDYQTRPTVATDKHKVMQILVNLVRNAKHACDESAGATKRVVIRITADPQSVKIAVIDNGVGISPENLTRIFAHGFTTRKHGHGFGLHSGALAAKQLGGSIAVQSDGPGQGATFTLELPLGTEAARSLRPSP